MPGELPHEARGPSCSPRRRRDPELCSSRWCCMVVRSPRGRRGGDHTLPHGVDHRAGTQADTRRSTSTPNVKHLRSIVEGCVVRPWINSAIDAGAVRSTPVWSRLIDPGCPLRRRHLLRPHRRGKGQLRQIRWNRHGLHRPKTGQGAVAGRLPTIQPLESVNCEWESGLQCHFASEVSTTQRLDQERTTDRRHPVEAAGSAPT